MKIVKRDGHIVDYDPEKIRIAIGKANNEVKGKEKASKDEIEEMPMMRLKDNYRINLQQKFGNYLGRIGDNVYHKN